MHKIISFLYIISRTLLKWFLKGVFKLLQVQNDDTLLQNIDVKEQSIKELKVKDFLNVLNEMVQDYNCEVLN